MYCTQCGAKIEDGFKFCPGCGAQAVSVQSGGQNFNHGSSLEKVSWHEESLADIMMSVAKEYPKDSTTAIKKLSRITGIGIMKLTFVMSDVWAGKDPRTLKEYSSMEKKYKKNRNVLCCPRCGSLELQYKLGSLWAHTSGSATLFDNPKTRVRCVECGKQWCISSNQWKEV